MSSALGIASVTHVLKDLLNDGFINQNVTDVLGTPIHVSSLPPGELQTGNNGAIPSQINLFLYRVTYNTGWVNRGFPTRDTDGKLVQSVPLALDLHYLLTSFGERELHSEIILGYSMQVLHENPVLDRDAIRDSLTPASITDPLGRLPANLSHLAISGLADQIEMIKITPETLNTEDISKLWSAFQTKYRTCTGYMVTVVLIDVDKPSHPALPVQQRKIYSLQLRYPKINKIASQASSLDPVSEIRKIIIGDILVILGAQLKNNSVLIKINESEIVPMTANVSENKISIQLTTAMGLKAGMQGVQVVHQVTVGEIPNDHDVKWASSNLHAFVLCPDLNSITANNFITLTNGLREGEIDVQLTPAVRPQQRVVLYLDELNPPTGNEATTYAFVFPVDEIVIATNTLTFEVTNVKDAAYLVRIQVDGAESLLETNSAGEYDHPTIIIP
ncbi:MAG TPA: DUF4255 domain-containing protein [Saprospiraceae bacterium]